MTGCSAGGIVYVDLGEFYLSRVGLRQFVQNRLQLSAVASPQGGKIDEHRAGKRADLGLEAGIGHFDDTIGVES